MNDTEELTHEQIKNWRNVLSGLIGPVAFILPDARIQALRDNFQKEANKIEKQP